MDARCKELFAQSKFVTDPRIKSARKAMSKRFQLLGVLIIFVIILIYFCIQFITAIIDSVSTYNMTKANQESFQSKINSRVIIANKEYDDEKYEEDKDVVLVDEYKEYKRNMSSIKQTYAEFNKKVTAYQRALNKDVTDNIDEGIMLKENDNY